MLTTKIEEQNQSKLNECSFAKNIKETSLERTTLTNILESIQKEESLKTKIEELRSCSDPNYKSKLKNNLPYFILGTFKNDNRAKKDFESTRFMVLDIDKLKSGKLEELKSKLKNDKSVFAFFTSPSGDGIKIIYRFNEKIDDNELFTNTYNFYASKFNKHYTVETDKTNDSSRACFFSYDPDLYINDAAEYLEVVKDFKLSEEEESTKTKSSKNRVKNENKAENEEEAKTISLYTIVRKADGQEIRIEEINSKTSVFCPFCIHDSEHRKNPNTANAFIDKNSSGTYYLHCSSEHTTYWQKSINKEGIFTKEGNEYFKMKKFGKEFTEVKLSTFIIEPMELLVMDDSDTLLCDVKTVQGNIYKDILIDNKDWLSKAKMLTAIGHQDCVFLGSDNDVQLLCAMISQKVPVRKTGTKTIGLHDDTWVIDKANIKPTGIIDKPTIVPCEKGGEAFHKKISYPTLSDEETKDLLKNYYDNILKINREETIIPFVSWSFITPLKPGILKKMGGFPHLFVHGAHGSGKTSTAILHMRQYGYKTSGTYSCTMRQFPMLKLLNATNAIPLVFDEFKKQDLSPVHLDSMLRLMRNSYSAEVETKGRADQTTVDYQLNAPMIVMGEWNTTQPAVRERIIVSSFNNAVKTDTKMQDAFEKLKQLPLESFMNSYIPFVLNQDVEQLLEESSIAIKNHFKNLSIVPRIKNNLIIMYGGYLLFRRFAEANNIPLDNVNMDKVLDFQLQEITGNNTGQVESAVDQLLEGLSNMAAGGNDITEDYDYRIFNRDSNGIRALALPIQKLLPNFKEWARKTSYDIEFLDDKSYSKLFDDIEYIVDKSKVEKLQKKSTRFLYIDIDKALKAGVDLEGFIGVQEKDTADSIFEEVEAA